MKTFIVESSLFLNRLKVKAQRFECTLDSIEFFVDDESGVHRVAVVYHPTVVFEDGMIEDISKTKQ